MCVRCVCGVCAGCVRGTCDHMLALLKWSATATWVSAEADSHCWSDASSQIALRVEVVASRAWLMRVGGRGNAAYASREGLTGGEQGGAN